MGGSVVDREIKFRGKSVTDNSWVYGCYLFDKEFKRHRILCEHGCVYEVIPETVSQYTGLKDKNGKEIYCSDVWKGKMCFGPMGVQDETVSIHKYLLDFGKGFGYGDWERGEVIGNIYENPELLTKDMDSIKTLIEE